MREVDFPQRIKKKRGREEDNVEAVHGFWDDSVTGKVTRPPSLLGSVNATM